VAFALGSFCAVCAAVDPIRRMRTVLLQ